jgi:sterol carrier protein 2
MKKAYICGLGMTNFVKPDDNNLDYNQLAAQAITEALVDAKLSFSQIEQAFCGYIYGDSTSG